MQRGMQRAQEDATTTLLMMARTCPDTCKLMRELNTVVALKEVLMEGSDRARMKTQAQSNMLERGGNEGSF